MGALLIVSSHTPGLASPAIVYCQTLTTPPVELTFEVNSELDPSAGTMTFAFVADASETTFTIRLSDPYCYSLAPAELWVRTRSMTLARCLALNAPTVSLTPEVPGC